MRQKILVFGTFDFLHIGHIYFLRQAKRCADTVVIALARDEVVKQLKGSYPIHRERERKELLQHVDLIDEVVYGDKTIGTYQIITRIKPTVVGIGYDQVDLYKDLQSFTKRKKISIRIIRLKPYRANERKSTLIRNIIRTAGNL
ncbi:MAG: hypothetical protein A3J66_01250 [Candidatus Magasanikbacteria bacterium RIFCSPHIGHO2_02_FULL_47_14]|uniref:Cytidyltransferase-like domain-containing protein n=1 Tax=Candidatus Magasanikbacteria bacterium RIFCSPHIGHO2_02_FULL_47_14 TaxID=1798680 RepID=A0A1F6M091_9BACT|nr:MAG: hypothetical protein A3J66_01250 [Candidatus Magasanikbacteria bacterium RIFCSPHIGHO2_02_FULL_47_14]